MSPAEESPGTTSNGRSVPPASKLWSVRALVLIVVLATLTPGVIGVSLLLYRLYQDGRQQSEKDTIETARAMVRAVDGQLKYTKAVALALSTSPLIARSDWSAFHLYAGNLVRTEGITSNVVVFDPSGQQLVNTQLPLGQPLPRQPDWPQFRSVFENRLPFVTNVVVHPSTPQAIASVVVPVFNGDSVPYALSLSVSPDQLGEILAQQGLPDTWRSFIADPAGVLASMSSRGHDYVGTSINPTLRSQLAARSEGAIDAVTKEGVPALVAFSQSPSSRWLVAIAIPSNTLQADLRHDFFLSGAVGLLLFAASASVAWLMGGRIASSVQNLTRSAVAMESGEHVPPPTVSFREAEQAGSAMVRTSEMLQQRAEALLAADASLSEERRNALAADVQTLKAKTQFLAMVSHELRSPLQAILSAVNLLELGHGQGVERRAVASRSLPVIRTAVDSLSTHVRDLLTLASGEAGRLEMRPEVFDAVALVEEIVDLQRQAAESKGLYLQLLAPRDPAFVVADPTRVTQVLTNLLSNAIKYTVHGGVKVSLTYKSHSGSSIDLAVEDTGPGVAETFAAQLFSPYERRGSVEPDRQSAGIGLAVVQTVVRHLGGTVDVETTIGVGTTFKVWIPVASVSDRETVHPPGSSNVLIVDDRQDILAGLAAVITAQGHRCDIADSAAVGANLLGAQVYDLVLIDLNMPVKSGYELASETRRGGGINARSVLVAISADDVDEVGKAWPFDGFLAKPIDRKTLADTLAWSDRENTARRSAHAPSA